MGGLAALATRNGRSSRRTDRYDNDHDEREKQKAILLCKGASRDAAGEKKTPLPDAWQTRALLVLLQEQAVGLPELLALLRRVPRLPGAPLALLAEVGELLLEARVAPVELAVVAPQGGVTEGLQDAADALRKPGVGNDAGVPPREASEVVDPRTRPPGDFRSEAWLEVGASARGGRL